MATKEGSGSSSRNDSADQSTGAKPYLPEGSALPAGLSPFLLALKCLFCFVLNPPGVSNAG